MNGKKYLDSEKVIMLLRKDLICKYPSSFSFGLWAAADEIAKMDGEGVRPVVRCRDCKIQQVCKVAQYLGEEGFCSNGEKDVRSLRKCKLYKDCEYRTLWKCCCEDCSVWE